MHFAHALYCIGFENVIVFIKGIYDLIRFCRCSSAKYLS